MSIKKARLTFLTLLFLCSIIKAQEKRKFIIISNQTTDSVTILPTSVISKKINEFEYIISEEPFCVTLYSETGKAKKCFTPPYKSTLFFKRHTGNQLLDTVSIEYKRKKDLTTAAPAINISGENDPIMNATILPGIQGAGEFQQGIFVRGSSSDKNRYTLDNATVYAPFHQFGLFSVFNDDIIQSAQISTNSFSGNLGGRTGGYMDIKTKTHLNDSITKRASVGLLSSKIAVHKKLSENSNILGSARGTYGNLITTPIIGNQYNAYFYDGSLKYNRNFKRSILSIGSHFSIDNNKFNLEIDAEEKTYFQTRWFNWTNIINYKKFFKNNNSIAIHFTNSNFKLANSSKGVWNYENPSEYKKNQEQTLILNSRINDINNQVIYSSKNFQVGIDQTVHQISPQYKYNLEYEDSSANNKLTEITNTYENAVFINYTLSKKIIDLQIALRNNLYWNKQLFSRLSPRGKITFKVNKQNSIGAAYDRTNQFIYSLQANSIGLPNDVWLTSGQNMPVQMADQITLNYQLQTSFISLQTALFWKQENGIIRYQPGNTFSLGTSPTNIEESAAIPFQERIIVGKQKGYGLEVLLTLEQENTKQSISYTYSQFTSFFEETNRGEWFNSDQNRPHKLNINAQVKINTKWFFTANWAINSGRNATFYNTNFDFEDHMYILLRDRTIPYIEELNNFRFPLYHRLDINFSKTITKAKSIFKWDIGIINLYNKRNINFYFSQASKVSSISLLPILPTTSLKWQW